MKTGKRTCLVAVVMFLLALSSVSIGCNSSTDEVTATPAGGKVTRYESGYRFDCNGWIYVHIEGEPYERGFQHGRLVARELADAIKTLKRFTLDDTGQDWSYFVEAAERLFVQDGQEEFLEEIKGIADGARSAGTEVTWREVLAWNGNMELTGYWYPGILAGDYDDGTDKTHCSAFLATGSYTEGGKVVMAHNDWDHFAEGQADRALDALQSGAGVTPNSPSGRTRISANMQITGIKATSSRGTHDGPGWKERAGYRGSRISRLEAGETAGRQAGY